MLQATNLTYCIGPKTLLRDVSLTLRPGEVLAVAGPNGAGKSTLLRLLSGDLRPSAGAVALAGTPLGRWPAAALACRRAVLAQQHALALAFTVRELVLLGRYPHFGSQPSAHDHAVVEAALALVGLTPLAGREYPTLSGGEQQRAQLARTLAQVWEAEDGLLLLDEPLSGLDLRHQHHTLAVARQLAGRGFAVLTVLHDLNLAAQYAHRVLLLYQGRPVATGTPGQVLTPDYIQLAFGLEVELLAHPTLGCPLIVPVAPAEATGPPGW